ncbi:hypothetical protein ACI79C_03380 [Geodermatophilus sp. SYSU D00697]
MAGCGHIFSQPGCPSCAAGRATTAQDQRAAGLMYAQAQLDQAAETNSRLAELNASAQRQEDLARAQMDQARRFQIAQWSQTPDGQAYTAWAAAAPHVLQVIDHADQTWAQAWRDAVAERVSPEAIEPRRLLLGRPAVGIALVVAVLIANGMTEGFWQAVTFVAFFASIVAAVVMAVRQKRIVRAARAERTAVYGFDPFTEPVPSWSTQRDPAELRAAVHTVLAAGPEAFPAARSLPPLTLPEVESHIWPKPLDVVSAGLTAVVEVADQRIAALRASASA